jgi:hypothetical protein
MNLHNWIASCFNRIARGKKTSGSGRRGSTRDRRVRLCVELLEERAMLSAAPGLSYYVQTNLVSNIQGMALKTDLNLVNPWDVNAPQDTNSDPAYYVADQGSGMATAYRISPDGSTVIVESGLAVTIPTVGCSEPSGPTGVANNTNPTDFLIPGPDGSPVAASYIFDTLQGTIGGYSLDADGNLITNPAEIMYNSSDSPAPRMRSTSYGSTAAAA